MIENWIYLKYNKMRRIRSEQINVLILISYCYNITVLDYLILQYLI